MMDRSPQRVKVTTLMRILIDYMTLAGSAGLGWTVILSVQQIYEMTVHLPLCTRPQLAVIYVAIDVSNDKSWAKSHESSLIIIIVNKIVFVEAVKSCVKLNDKKHVMKAGTVTVYIIFGNLWWFSCRSRTAFPVRSQRSSSWNLDVSSPIVPSNACRILKAVAGTVAAQ